MPLQNFMSEISAEAKAWRRQLHQYPELLFDLPGTSAMVATKLREFGCDQVVTGMAKTGVVGVIKGKLGVGKTVGFRADMDALPMSEQTDLPHASKIPNMMHACGHDGHTATLLAAAKYLAATREFFGTIILIFQPAEEGGAGARVMIEDGLLERFRIEEVYGMHNKPGLPIGSFAIRSGPILAAGDRFVVTLNGRGGHAAYPHLTRDPVLAGAHLVGTLQSITSRYIDPFDPVVVSVSYFSAGDPNALNVIPDSIEIGGIIRTVKPQTRKSVEVRFRDIVSSAARLFEAKAEIDWRPGYPATINDPAKAIAARFAAKSVAGDDKVEAECPCEMGSEDFSFMLEKKPGALIWFGNGDSATLHNSKYDFDDNAIIHGMRYWIALADQQLGKRNSFATL